MGSSIPLPQQISTMKQTLLDEGFVDEQFVVLEKLNSPAQPNFAQDTISLFYVDTKETVTTLQVEMRKHDIDYKLLDVNLHKLKGSCVSVGAKKAAMQVDMARKYFDEGNLTGVSAAFGQLIWENEALQARLAHYFQLVKRANCVSLNVKPPNE